VGSMEAARRNRGVAGVDAETIQPLNNEAWGSFWWKSKPALRAGRHRPGAPSGLGEAAADPEGTPDPDGGGLEWCRWRRSWLSSQSSKRISSRAVMDFVRRKARPRPWKRSV